MLEGTLDSFTLPDVFQLLAFTEKSGCLELSAHGHDGQVWFRDGHVYYAVASRGRLALGKRLVGAGVVDAERLAAALDAQGQGRREGQGLRLGQILVREGVVDETTLETFVQEQIQDAVFDLMRWTEGSFRFDTEAEELDEPITLTVSVENLIMEGSRRLEEWESVRKKIPTRRAVVAMAPPPADGGVEVNLQPEEWRLLTLVDGRRTVADLVDLYGQGEFATCKVLYGLVGAGLLEVRDPELEGPPSIAALLEQQELLRALEEDDAAPAARPAHPERPATAAVASTPAAPDEREPEPAASAPAAPDEPEDEPVADSEPEPQPDARPDAQPDPDPEPEPEPVAALAANGSSTGATPAAGGDEQRRLTTDPSIDADLVSRLIDGVKDL